MEFNKARLISYSKMMDDNGIELSILEQIAYCARVSNPSNQNNHNSSERLCEYLYKNHHFSPFEMVNICIEIETTRDISRQILRHRSFSFQEFSQRYAVATDFITRECRLQHPTNRQMSVDIVNSNSDSNSNSNSDSDSGNKDITKRFQEIQSELILKQQEYYQYCIQNNIAKEQARVILSEGLTKTKLYMNGTVRSWIHYLQLRCDKDTTQKEHCDIALKILDEIEKVFPIKKMCYKK